MHGAGSLCEGKSQKPPGICTGFKSVQRAVENHGIEEKKSAKTVKKIDKERTSFYNFYTNMKWADARDFDLCINTSKITIDEAVEIILETVKRHYKDEIK